MDFYQLIMYEKDIGMIRERKKHQKYPPKESKKANEKKRPIEPRVRTISTRTFQSFIRNHDEIRCQLQFLDTFDRFGVFLSLFFSFLFWKKISNIYLKAYTTNTYTSYTMQRQVIYHFIVDQILGLSMSILLYFRKIVFIFCVFEFRQA